MFLLLQSVNSKPTVNSESSSAAASAMLGGAAQSAGAKPAVIGQPGGSEVRVLDKRRLQELVKEVDPLEQLDDDVEEVGIILWPNNCSCRLFGS